MKKIIFFILFIAGSSIVLANSTDTIPKITARPLVFENAFRNDPKFEDPTVFASFYTVDLGKIKIETGRLIACDASDMHKYPAFNEIFPRGEFPVQLSVVKAEAGEAEYVAYTRIVFSQKPVRKWSYALKPGDYFREPWDSTTRIRCIFMGEMGMQTTVIADSVSSNAFIKKPHTEWGAVFVEPFKRTGKKGFIHSFNDHNLVSVATFFNPCYAAYIGYDDQGKPCRLLLDPGNFQIQKSLF
ncbi:MAG TPA: DUF4241 domain-containing protein [Chitinophagaceae bacterium]|nr:DUF4241 domain-containing protein [Chitinophagaceae bacterium]